MNVKTTEPLEGDFSLRPKTRSRVDEMPDGPVPAGAVKTTEEPRDWQEDK